MNILIDTLPTAVMVGDQEIQINTDFRDCLRVILAFEDADLTLAEKTMIMLDNLYTETPPDAQEAVLQAVKFLNQGADDDAEAATDGLRLYGFGQDANLIYAAFHQTHGIDLEAVEGLHWWKFMALFMDLGADTAFCQLVGLRKRVKTGKASKEERQAARDMGDTFELQEPDTRTPDERARGDEFLRLAQEGQRKRNAERQAQETAASE